MTKETEKLAKKALDGLRHCLPVGWGEKDAELSCADCPYYETGGRMCDDLEDVTLPAALVEDLRTALKKAVKEGIW